MSKPPKPKSVDEHLATIREKLSEARRLSGLTQTTVADALGLSNSQYSRFESGANEMTLRQFLVACEELRLNPAELLATHVSETVSDLRARLNASEGKLAALAAAALCIAADGAFAHGGNGEHDHGHPDQSLMNGIKSRDSRAGEKHAKSGIDKDHGDKQKYSERHKSKDGDRRAQKDNEKNRTPVANTIHPIINKGPIVTASGKPAHTAPANNIHPIINSQPISGAQSTAGTLPPNDPVGNTHPAPGTNPPTVVTVSNGVSTYQLQNGPGGVAVYSDRPGSITVTNGTESKTLTGGSLTLSGTVIGVGAGQNIEVGTRNNEGNTVVAIKPEPPPATPLPNGGNNDFRSGGGVGVDILNGVSDFGYGLTHGFAPGPAPPPTTSTTTQY
jgi:transcriptional regulator with XRE-family HTH domain